MNRVSRATRVAQFVALAALGLTGCSDFGPKSTAYTCPQATTVPDLQTIARVAPSGKDEDVQTAGRIASVSAACKDEEGGVVTNLSIDFTALRTGPGIKHIDLPYFVAIADATGNILGKQVFAIGLDFPGETATMKTTEKVTTHLPLKNPQLGDVYTIIVGFQLTRSEIDFNRAHQQ
jgi:hypothetical protein